MLHLHTEASAAMPLVLSVQLLLLSIFCLFERLLIFVLEVLEFVLLLIFCSFEWFLKFGWSHLDF